MLGWPEERVLLGVGIATVACVFLLRFVIFYLFEKNGLIWDEPPWWPPVDARQRLISVFHVALEEMVLRAALLESLRSVLLRTSRRFAFLASSRVQLLILVLLPALAFTTLHEGLYRHLEGRSLVWATHLNLFLLGSFLNALYLRCGHIGWGYALHLGWNISRFRAELRPLSDPGGPVLSEGETFNHVESDPVITAALALFWLFFLLWPRLRAFSMKSKA